MSDENKNTSYDVPLDDHEYDGIQEFNNPAPFWWQLLFYLSIAFAVGYYAYYEVLGGPSSDSEISEKITAVRRLQNENKSEGPDQSTLQAVLVSAEAQKAGKEIYLGKCAACHAADGGGLVGPNLTDAYWIHGKGEAMDLYTVIRDGVGSKGMPPWGAILSETEMLQVVSFVYAFQGTTPAQAKAPQGDEVKQ